MLQTLPFNIIPDQTDFTFGVPDDNIQTAPSTPHPTQELLEWSQPSAEVAPISTYHSMNTFSERDKLIAYMELAGNKNKDIAAAVGLQPQSISQIKRRPEYKLFLSEEAKRVRETTHQSIQERIMGDAHRNLDVLMQIRDGVADQSGTPDWSNRRQAAQEIFARQYPRVTKTETLEDRTYHFESRTFENMFKALAGAQEVNSDGKSPEEVIDILTKQLPPGGNNNAQK